MATIKYSQIKCLAFCRRMTAALPIELRELVYQSLYFGKLVCTVDDDVQRWDCDDNDDIFPFSEAKHIWDAEFVGPAVAGEIARHCYRNAAIHFDNASQIPTFLKWPIPHTFLTPKDIITSVSVVIDDRSWMVNKFNDLPPRSIYESSERLGSPPSDLTPLMKRTSLSNNDRQPIWNNREALSQGLLALRRVESRLLELKVFVDVGYKSIYSSSEFGNIAAINAGYLAMEDLLSIKKLNPVWNVMLYTGGRGDQGHGNAVEVSEEYWPAEVWRGDVRGIIWAWRESSEFKDRDKLSR